MSAAAVVVLVAAVVACVAAVAAVVAAVVLTTQVRRLERSLAVLERETLPIVEGAQRAVDHATTEMARIEAVLEDTESVTAAVDSASRLAQRAFASPVVKILAYRAGTARGISRLRQGPADGDRAGRTGGDHGRTHRRVAGR